MILTAEADSLPTDARQLLEDCGLMGCHSVRGNYLSVHARIDATGYVRHLWESNDEEDKGYTDSRERAADTFSNDLEYVAEVLEENDTKSNFPRTAEFLRDRKERQLVTRSGLPRIRCCVRSSS